MEVSGKSGAEVMQGWIREEFASILHKRNRGLPDEVQRIRHELQIPEFSGGNLEDWIYQLEDFFHFFQLQEEEKLKAAMIALDGDALQWFEWENERQSFYEWLDLKVLLLQVFGSAPACFWQPSTPMLTGKVESQNLSLVHEYGGLSGFVEGCTKQGKSGGPCRASVVVPEENQGSSHQKVASEKIEVAKRVDLENHGFDGLQKLLSTDESSFTWWWKSSFEKGNRILRGSSDGNKLDLTWNFNASGGGRFVKGGSETCGSGGGPGSGGDVELAGVEGIRSCREESEKSLLEVDEKLHGTSVILEKNPERGKGNLVKKSIKGSMVKVLPKDIIPDFRLGEVREIAVNKDLQGCPIKCHEEMQGSGPEFLQPTSLITATGLLKPKHLNQPNSKPLKHSFPSQFFKPTPSIKIFNPHFPTLKHATPPKFNSHLLTHSTKSMTDFHQSTSISQTQFLQPTLGTCQFAVQAVLIYIQISPIQRPNRTHHLQTLPDHNVTTKSHCMAASYNPQDLFTIAMLLKEVRGLDNEVLERQAKPGINFKVVTVHCYQSRECTANYYPP